jgi:hypothetical protein
MRWKKEFSCARVHIPIGANAIDSGRRRDTLLLRRTCERLIKALVALNHGMSFLAIELVDWAFAIAS